jgi:cyclohexa-1,5-dienecarbonyl-CoA hydratase
MPERIHIRYDGPACHIILADGRANVIDIPMMEALHAAIKDAESKPEITTLLFRGQGGNFSGGVDIPSHAPETVAAMLQQFHAFILALAATQKVTLALVEGNCLGGGAELALMCDMVYTTLDAKWGFPEVTLGCYPPVACAALASVVGQKRAAQLILTGETITGRDAMLIGLATASGPLPEIEQYAQQTVARLAALSPAALRHAKKASYAWNAMHLDKGLARAEKIYLEELMQTEDAKEGIRAWTENRAPKWKGK